MNESIVDQDLPVVVGPNDLGGGACTTADSGQEASVMSDIDWWSFLGSDQFNASSYATGLDQSHHLRSSTISSDMSAAVAPAGGSGGDNPGRGDPLRPNKGKGKEDPLEIGELGDDDGEGSRGLW
jgi:hypothetical protein